MRLAGSILAMMVLVGQAVVARSPSQGNRRQHGSVQLSASSSTSTSRLEQRTWNNISAPFSTGDDDEMVVRGLTNASAKRKKPPGTAARNAKDWGKKHKRKMASLMSIAEQDRRLSMMHLPPIPSARLPERHPSSGLECCPTVVEVVQPSGGTNMDGHVVELYRHGDLDQRIYEHSCRPDVLNQPCRFVEKMLRPLSRCVQQFSFTYAVVTDHPSSNEWRLDYIRIRNGCACEIQPP